MRGQDSVEGMGTSGVNVSSAWPNLGQEENHRRRRPAVQATAHTFSYMPELNPD